MREENMKRLIKATGSRGRYAIFLFCVLATIATTTATNPNVRPEIVFTEIFRKPLASSHMRTQQCMHDSEIYEVELAKYRPWALQMFDASVKMSPGIITGNYKQLGNFDECLQVINEHGFIGQACHAAVNFEISADDGDQPRALDLGDLLVNVAIASNATKWRSGSTVVHEWMWCVPSSCTHYDIQEAIEMALDPLKVDGRVDVIVNVPKESCYTAETIRISWDFFDYLYALILVLFALIIIVSTGYDIAKERGLIAGERKDILVSFSFYTNGEKLLKTDRGGRKSISCLDGLRFFSLCWIIFGHTYYLEVVGVKLNLTQVPQMHLNWSNMLILNGNIATDTFFMASGILLAYNQLSQEVKNPLKCLNVLSLYIHRYLRLTPAYAMMIGFYATLFYKFGTGAYWDLYVGSNRNYCRENWWTNLLYINNFVNVPSMCMSQSWYLATEMQLILLSPIILYPMLKLKTHFFAIIFCISLCLSVTIPFIITYNLGLTGTMLYYKDNTDMAQVYLKIYTKAYSRFGSYLVGLGLGYVLHKMRSNTVKLNISVVIGGWLVAIVAGLSVVFGPRGMYFDNYVYNPLEASLYASLHRQVFALAVCWIVFCCENGYAGPVNSLLSWKVWTSANKLTYCAYLSHYLFLLSDVGSVRTTGNLTTMNVVRATFANLMLTMILSVLWSLCFEIPFLNIDRIIFAKCKQTPPPTNKDDYRFNRKVCHSADEPSTAGHDANAAKYGVNDNTAIVIDRCIDNTERRADAEAKGNSEQIYIIDTDNVDNAHLVMSNDSKDVNSYVNVNYEEVEPPTSLAGRLGSIGSGRMELNRSLRNSNSVL